MGLHALETGNMGRRLANLGVGLAGHALRGYDIHIFMHQKPPRIVGRAFCLQNVVGSRTFVAEGDGDFLAEEQLAVISQTHGIPVITGSMHLAMLGGIFVRYGDSLLVTFAQDHLTLIAPCSGCSAACYFRQCGDQAVHARHHLIG